MWQYNHVDELAHYGVLGMKWGVRKDPSRAYSKAVKKKTKLDKKSVKLNLKASKKQYKAAKKLKRAVTEVDRDKAIQLQVKASKMGYKSAKLQEKGRKWVKAMDEVFANYKVEKTSTGYKLTPIDDDEE